MEQKEGEVIDKGLDQGPKRGTTLGRSGVKRSPRVTRKTTGQQGDKVQQDDQGLQGDQCQQGDQGQQSAEASPSKHDTSPLIPKEILEGKEEEPIRSTDPPASADAEEQAHGTSGLPQKEIEEEEDAIRSASPDPEKQAHGSPQKEIEEEEDVIRSATPDPEEKEHGPPQKEIEEEEDVIRPASLNPEEIAHGLSQKEILEDEVDLIRFNDSPVPPQECKTIPYSPPKVLVVEEPIRFTDPPSFPPETQIKKSPGHSSSQMDLEGDDCPIVLNDSPESPDTEEQAQGTLTGSLQKMILEKEDDAIRSASPDTEGQEHCTLPGSPQKMIFGEKDDVIQSASPDPEGQEHGTFAGSPQKMILGEEDDAIRSASPDPEGQEHGTLPGLPQKMILGEGDDVIRSASPDPGPVEAQEEQGPSTTHNLVRRLAIAIPRRRLTKGLVKLSFDEAKKVADFWGASSSPSPSPPQEEKVVRPASPTQALREFFKDNPLRYLPGWCGKAKGYPSRGHKK